MSHTHVNAEAEKQRSKERTIKDHHAGRGTYERALLIFHLLALLSEHMQAQLSKGYKVWLLPTKQVCLCVCVFVDCAHIGASGSNPTDH